MNANASKQDRDTCLKSCEADFIRFTAREPVGGVEMLRVCRETCPADAPGEKRPVK